MAAQPTRSISEEHTEAEAGAAGANGPRVPDQPGDGFAAIGRQAALGGRWQATVWVAEAQLTRAKVLWIPQLNIGFDYTRHDGGGPDFNKGIMTTA